MAFSTPYTKLNFVSFTLACFCTISYVVFLSATQSFFLTDVLGISHKIGDYIGTLGFADEILSIALSPLLGALSDKIGPKYISSFGVFVIGISFFVYTSVKNVYPQLLLARLLFALGATAGAGMLTALLAELSASGFELKSLFTFGSPASDNEESVIAAVTNEVSDGEGSDPTPVKRNGKITSVIGMATGLGAVFSVTVYLPLPSRLGKTEPSAQALKHSYMIIGSIAIASSFFLLYGLFSSKKLRIPLLSKYLSPYDDVLEELEEDELETERESFDKSYLELLKLGFAEAKDPKVSLAYAGGFVSRSTTVATSVFIPLYVNHYYLKTGKCEVGGKANCREAYVQAAILTGIINTVCLCLAPVFGYVADRFGRNSALIATCISGLVASFGFTFLGSPTSAAAYVLCIFFGAAQIGVIITSMSLVTDKHRSHNGAVSGVYGFCGGVGILIIVKLGGFTADYWAGAPFLILAVFYLILLSATLYIGNKLQYITSKFNFNTNSVALPLTDE